MRARLQRLRAELASDARALEARLDELAAVDLAACGADAGTLARAAVALHHGYGAIEALLTRVARLLDGGRPEGPDWHTALLNVMALDIEDVRPAVIGPDSLHRLRRLLAFRHFFRHAYAVELDVQRLAALREDALQVRAPLTRDLAHFDAWLAQLAASADG